MRIDQSHLLSALYSAGRTDLHLQWYPSVVNMSVFIEVLKD